MDQDTLAAACVGMYNVTDGDEPWGVSGGSYSHWTSIGDVELISPKYFFTSQTWWRRNDHLPPARESPVPGVLSCWVSIRATAQSNWTVLVCLNRGTVAKNFGTAGENNRLWPERSASNSRRFHAEVVLSCAVILYSRRDAARGDLKKSCSPSPTSVWFTLNQTRFTPGLASVWQVRFAELFCTAPP